jgi:hypothetical protein
MFKWLIVKIDKRRKKRELKKFLALVSLMEKAEREYVENYPFKEFL